MLKTFKNETVNIEDMHSIALMIMYSLIIFGRENNIPITITDARSTLENDISIHRKTATHREGRAFDVRTIGLTKEQINNIIFFLNDKFFKYGAYSSETGKKTLVVYHVGTAEHLHVQIEKKYDDDFY